MLRIRGQQDVAAGLFFIVIGILAIYLVKDLAMGRAVRMGPAYIPTMLGWIMITLGVIVAGNGIVFEGPKLERWALPILGIILASIVVFGALIERAGLVIASIGMMIVATVAAADRKWVETLIFIACMTVFCVVLFKNLLGLPLPVWPPR